MSLCLMLVVHILLLCPLPFFPALWGREINLVLLDLGAAAMEMQVELWVAGGRGKRP